MTAVMDVMIVEDEVLLAMDIEAMVEDSGHRVVAEAASLDDVKTLPSELRPDLALVDLHLVKGSDGMDVSAYIQQRWPNTLIVFVTANAARLPTDLAGAHGVIAKPFSNAGIVSALDYLAEGVFDPPPSRPRPASLVPSAHLQRRWSTSD